MVRRNVARIEKKAEQEGRIILFADEAGFYLLPFVAKTYAPKGKTPLLRHKLSREHLSVMSAISENCRIYVQIQKESFKGTNVVEFLRHLSRHIKDAIMLIWDGSSIHKSKEVKKFLAEENNGKIHLETLPKYSPDLNPDESIWHYLKCVALKNVCCPNLKILEKLLRQAIRKLRTKKDVLSGCFRRVFGV